MVLHTYKDPKIKCVKKLFWIVIQYLLEMIVKKKKMGGGGE